MHILGLLGVLFVGLKLAEVGIVAKWSWTLVTLPFWGGIALWFVGLILTLIIAAFTHNKAIKQVRSLKFK